MAMNRKERLEFDRLTRAVAQRDRQLAELRVRAELDANGKELAALFDAADARKERDQAERDLAVAIAARNTAEEDRDGAQVDLVEGLAAVGKPLEVMAREVFTAASVDPHDPAWDLYFDLRGRIDAIAAAAEPTESERSERRDPPTRG